MRKFEKSRKKDRFAVALAGKKVKAFEYEVSPSEVYQAREGDGGLLTGSKLDMKVAEEEFSSSFYVGSDVAASSRVARAAITSGCLSVNLSSSPTEGLCRQEARWL